MENGNETEICPHCGGPDDHSGYGYNGRYYADCVEQHKSKQREATPEEVQRIADWFADHSRSPGESVLHSRGNL